MFVDAPLSLTSQFRFCGLPLRLDSYAGCAFRCVFCFARFREGSSYSAALRAADGEYLNRLFRFTFEREDSRPGILAQFLRKRVPIHFGGMSDPFQPAELRFRVTQSFLRALAKYKYPTVLSTRSALAASEPYLSLLKDLEHLVVQFSFCSTRDNIAARFEHFSPSPSTLLKTMSKLAKTGLRVSARWQPYIPGLSEPPEEFVERISETGCQHVALEHLKLPVERQHPLWNDLMKAARRDLLDYYKHSGARRDAREFVLPPKAKVRTILTTAEAVHRRGMSFGAADNEFQYLSDTHCCCSGVDRFPGFESWFKHQIGYAVRKSLGRKITYDSISREWAPDGSIDRYLNSDVRLSSRGNLIGTVRDHVRFRWNSPTTPGSPASFYGVIPTSELTSKGNLVYDWDQTILKELSETIKQGDRINRKSANKRCTA